MAVQAPRIDFSKTALSTSSMAPQRERRWQYNPAHIIAELSPTFNQSFSTLRCIPPPPAARPHLPGDTRRGTVGARWNLRGRPERIGGGPWPRGHRRCTTQSGTTSRRRSRSWASRSRPGWWDCRGSPLGRRARGGGPARQRERERDVSLQWQEMPFTVCYELQNSTLNWPAQGTL